MHRLAVYVKMELPFPQDLFLKNSEDSNLCFRLALLHLVSFLSAFYHHLLLYVWIFMLFHPFIQDRWGSLDHPICCIWFWRLNVHHKNWPGDFCKSIFVSDCLIQIVIRSLTMTLTVLLFWIHLFLLTLVFVLLQLSLHWEIQIMLLSQFPLNFPLTQREMPLFIMQLTTILVWIGMVFVIIWEMFHGRISFFTLGASAASVEFCKRL